MYYKVIILTLLMMVFVQDIRSKSVYWVMFPLLAGLFFLNQLTLRDFTEIRLVLLINFCFLSVQFFLVSAWFSLRNRKWINITNGLLGWGDILFAISLAFGLSVFSFVYFHILSLVLVSAGWAAWRILRKGNDQQVPLAGLQAILLAVILSADWWYFHWNLTQDDWAFKLIGQ